MGVSIKLTTASYSERIEELEKQLELLKELDSLSKYFKPLYNVNNIYMHEIRRIFAKYLRFNKNLSFAEIGRVFRINYNNAKNYSESDSKSYVAEEVRKNYKDWFEKNVYPVTHSGRKYSKNSDNVRNVARPFILKTVEKYGHQNPGTIYSYKVNS